MRAIVQDEYGSPCDVLREELVAEPIVDGNRVLVRVHAASVNPYDWHLVRGVPYIVRPRSGLLRPKHTTPGSDVAGRIEAVGGAVASFSPGDEVFAFAGTGGFAEYASVSEDTVGLKPRNLSFEQAAAVPLAGLTALQGLREHEPTRSGHSVLIVGASGGVGTFAIQIAKDSGAEVTGICSARNADLVRAIGADHVIDYGWEDFTRGRRRYDLILQLAGMASPSDCRRALTPGGTLVLSSGDSDGRWIGPVDRILKARLLSPLVGQRLAVLDTRPNAADLGILKELVEQERIAPVVSRTYPLGEAPEAIRQVEEGHTRGKVVISLQPG
jgi:NADPH:quinone reductase-like Zn-dependent oxidoreductase